MGFCCATIAPAKKSELSIFVIITDLMRLPGGEEDTIGYFCYHESL
jgi:hypothetical protein